MRTCAIYAYAMSVMASNRPRSLGYSCQEETNELIALRDGETYTICQCWECRLPAQFPSRIRASIFGKWPRRRYSPGPCASRRCPASRYIRPVSRPRIAQSTNARFVLQIFFHDLAVLRRFEKSRSGSSVACAFARQCVRNALDIFAHRHHGRVSHTPGSNPVRAPNSALP